MKKLLPSRKNEGVWNLCFEDLFKYIVSEFVLDKISKKTKSEILS